MWKLLFNEQRKIVAKKLYVNEHRLFLNQISSVEVNTNRSRPLDNIYGTAKLFSWILYALDVGFVRLISSFYLLRAGKCVEQFKLKRFSYLLQRQLISLPNPILWDL